MKLLHRYISFLMLSFLFSACISIKPIEFKTAENIRITQLDSKPAFQIELVFLNPNTFGVSVNELETVATLSGKKFFETSLNKQVGIERNSEFRMPVTVTMETSNLSQIFTSGIGGLLSGGKIPFHLNGDLKVEKFFLKKNFKFSWKEDLSLSSFNKWF